MHTALLKALLKNRDLGQSTLEASHKLCGLLKTGSGNSALVG